MAVEVILSPTLAKSPCGSPCQRFESSWIAYHIDCRLLIFLLLVRELQVTLLLNSKEYKAQPAKLCWSQDQNQRALVARATHRSPSQHSPEAPNSQKQQTRTETSLAATNVLVPYQLDFKGTTTLPRSNVAETLAYHAAHVTQVGIRCRGIRDCPNAQVTF